jgi:uncharacterized protein YndB with AHSA1/START domain
MITPNKIEKQVTLHAPLGRVWHAITDAREFGRWFGVSLDGDFAAGKVITGTFNKELDEAAIIEHQQRVGLSPSGIRQPENGFVFCTVERIEPQSYFSFRWIPYGIDAEVNPMTEPTTLVEFYLQESANGTLLRIVESSFERVPEHRRERAFRMNEGGWDGQAENVREYVETI